MGREQGEGEGLPIILYWHDSAAPDYIEELLETFRRHNPKTPHLVFDETAAEELIAERFSGRELAAFGPVRRRRCRRRIYREPRARTG